MIAAKISNRHPARIPFDPQKISFITDLLSGGKGGGASPLEGIPGGVIALLNSGVAEPCEGWGICFLLLLLSVAARIGQDVYEFWIREFANGCSGTKIASNEAGAISNAWKIVGLVPSFLLLAFVMRLARAWDDLPDQVASRFDFSGDPNSWMSKRWFAVIAVVFGTAFAAFVALLVFSSSSRVPVFVPAVLTLASFIFFLAFWQVINFNAYKKPFTTAWILTLVAFMLVLIFVGIFVQPGSLKK